MITGLAALVLLGTVSLIQASEFPHQLPLTVVELGNTLTLSCSVFGNEGGLFYWYKLQFGYMIQIVAAGSLKKIQLEGQFNNPKLSIKKNNAQYVLNIRNISKEDEATYYCQGGSAYKMEFINGTLVAVNDHKNLQKSFFVKQSPETEWVQQGNPVTLQCSLLSKNKENTDQCPAEHSVYWFRSGSGGSHPDVLYTHSDEQEERSCVHSLSKTIQDSSDTGTYYCAVVTCGQILFGEGTKVETRSELDPVVLVLGVLLACCVTVIVILIVILIFYVNQRKVCEVPSNVRMTTGAPRACHHLGHDWSAVDQSNNLPHFLSPSPCHSPSHLQTPAYAVANAI
ncbi:signal-regulatory protein beta-2-like [Centropristis striata]|uniref:signal-regulatory protein beta-2-like n=1 Tax=Centropristis striata TaxID=184440 RepID=UPI0027E0A17C|nr:signal-regulatory protein beta-2-like [Centropristis striata]